MPHVTFIHGIANKPPKDALLQAWLRSLKDGDGRDLGTEGVTSSMVHWADGMYKEPLSEAGYESSEDFERASALTPGRTEAEAESAWRSSLSDEQRRLVDGLAQKIGLDQMNKEEPVRTPGTGEKEYERVFLPWFLKREVMK